MIIFLRTIIRQQQQILLRKKQIFRLNSFRLLNNMDIKSWIRVSNIVNGFEISVKVVSAMAENFFQYFLENFQTMWVIRQSKLAANKVQTKL